MIPKLIQLHWMFDPLPDWGEKVIDEYERRFPDWEIKVLTEVPQAFPDDLRSIIDCASSGRYKADLVRYWTMYEYGGIYVDMDTRPMRSFDDLRDYDLFVPHIDNQLGHYVDICFIGSIPEHPFWLEVVEKCRGRFEESKDEGERLSRFFLHQIYDGLEENDDLNILYDVVDSASFEEAKKFVRGCRPKIWGGDSYIKHYMHWNHRKPSVSDRRGDYSLLKDIDDPPEELEFAFDIKERKWEKEESREYRSPAFHEMPNGDLVIDNRNPEKVDEPKGYKRSKRDRRRFVREFNE